MSRLPSSRSPLLSPGPNEGGEIANDEDIDYTRMMILHFTHILTHLWPACPSRSARVRGMSRARGCLAVGQTASTASRHAYQSDGRPALTWVCVAVLHSSFDAHSHGSPFPQQCQPLPCTTLPVSRCVSKVPMSIRRNHACDDTWVRGPCSDSHISNATFLDFHLSFFLVFLFSPLSSPFLRRQLHSTRQQGCPLQTYHPSQPSPLSSTGSLSTSQRRTLLNVLS